MSLEKPIPSGKRRDGNTTRLVDYYVQLLFATGQIKVEDYMVHQVSAMNTLNRILYNRIIGRLSTEHRHSYQTGVFIFDDKRLTIKLS